MSQPSPVKARCPKCNLTLPPDYDDPQCPSCNAQLVKMNEAARLAAKHDPDQSAKRNVTALRAFALLNLFGGVIAGIADFSKSDVLGLAFIIAGGLGYAVLSVIADMADDLREIRKNSTK